jgi:hypothetical protein
MHQLQREAEKAKTDVLTPSQTVIPNNEKPFQEESCEINNLQQIEENVEILEKHIKKQPRGIAPLHVLCINFYKRFIC